MLGRPLQRQAMQSAWPIYNTKWTIGLTVNAFSKSSKLSHSTPRLSSDG